MVVDMNLGPKVRGLGRRFWLQATALGLLPRAPAALAAASPSNDNDPLTYAPTTSAATKRVKSSVDIHSTVMLDRERAGMVGENALIAAAVAAAIAAAEAIVGG